MKSLPELQRDNLPRLHWSEIVTVTPNEAGATLDPFDEASMQHYFQHFLPPGPCIMCGAKQGGNGPMDAILGTARFRWGLCHGEGACSDCGYPARAYHRDVGPIKFLQAILQYHPDELRPRIESKEAGCAEEVRQGQEVGA